MGMQNWGHQEAASAAKWASPSSRPIDWHLFHNSRSGPFHWRWESQQSCRIFILFFPWECWWDWREVNANPQRLLEICFSWTRPDQPVQVGLLVMGLVVFREGRQHRKIVLRGVPVVNSLRHTLHPVSCSCFYLLHDEARLRCHTGWGPLGQSRGVLREEVVGVSRGDVGERLACSGRNWWVWRCRVEDGRLGGSGRSWI